MSMKKYLIIIDFLFQKYEIEYEENMTATEAIRKVQQFLFPSEKGEDQIYTVKDKDDDHTKLRLYRSTPSQYTQATPVTEPITPQDLDYNSYQFYLFRPIINVFITMHIIKETDLISGNKLAEFDIIYPIKKKFSDLKAYLNRTLTKYMKENNSKISELLQNGFKLLYKTEKGQYKEYNDKEYIEKSMNCKTVFFVINKNKNNEKYIYRTDYIYYIYRGFKVDNSFERKETSNKSYLDVLLRSDDEDKKEREPKYEINSLNHSDDDFYLYSLKREFILQELGGYNFTEKDIIVSFNGRVQTEKFNNMYDLLSDNDFYVFTIIVLSADMNNIYEKKSDRKYDIKVPENGRPLIIRIEFQGQNKGNNNNANSSNNSNFINNYYNRNPYNIHDNLNNPIQFSQNSTNIHTPGTNKIENTQNDEFSNQEDINNSDHENKEEEEENNDNAKNKEEEDNNDEENRNDDDDYIMEENGNDDDSGDDFSEEEEINIDNSSFENNDPIEINDDNNNNDNDNDNDNYNEIDDDYSNNHNIYDDEYDHVVETETEIDNERLLELFCFYYKKLITELTQIETPAPTYIPKLSKEDSLLFDKFLNYYNQYRENL